MSKKKRNRPAPRAEPQKRSIVGFWAGDDQELACAGYTNLAHNPEIITAVDTIARLIGAMTIHLMRNTEQGDVRIIDGLSRKGDISPNEYMTRSNFVQWIVRTMLLEGHGNALVWPRTQNGRLEELLPISPSYVSYIPEGLTGYKISIGGQEYEPGDMLHFVANPSSQYPWLGEGYQITLSTVAGNLKQAAATEKGFMSSKWKPSLIVKVDAMTDEFSGPAGRRKLLEDYALSGEAGEPWLIPAEQFSIEQVKPLTLSDLALADFVKLDKQTVASILGVPAFVLGVGEYQRDAWNNFVSTRIMPLAQGIQQEFTRKLLYSPDLYFRFNSRSLYNYELSELSKVADDQFVRGIMTGNEVRDWIGLSPREGLDELVILENYIPRSMIGEQNKLKGGNEE